MSKYHPDDIMLLDYAAGNMPPAQSLAIATHIFLCGHCRGQVKRLNHLGGLMLEQTGNGQVDLADFDQLMAHIEQTPAPDASPSDRERPTHPLLRYLPTSLAELPWKKQTGDVSKFDLTALLNIEGFQVVLQKVKAGARIPTHTHKGEEFTVVISGGFSDELGVYHEGDFIARDGSHQHTPTTLQNEDCICLTVLDAPIKFVGRFHRLLNPFLRWL